MAQTPEEAKTQWLKWLEGYDKSRLYDSLLQSIQGAKSTCQHCGHHIYCDIVEGGGVPDWKTKDGDYGCFKSPDTTDSGTGGHTPKGVKYVKYVEPPEQDELAEDFLITKALGL